MHVVAVTIRRLHVIPLAQHIVHFRGYHASVLPSFISKTSPEFQTKAESMNELVRNLEQKMAAARQGGGPKAAERMKSKGKKLPRERFVFFLPRLLCANNIYKKPKSPARL